MAVTLPTPGSVSPTLTLRMSGEPGCEIQAVPGFADFKTQPDASFVAAGAIYLTITFLLTRATQLLEWRLTPHLRALPTSPVAATSKVSA